MFGRILTGEMDLNDLKASARRESNIVNQLNVNNNFNIEDYNTKAQVPPLQRTRLSPRKMASQ